MALFYDTVPDSWVARAYPSMMGLAAWFADLLLRIRVRTVSASHRRPAPPPQRPLGLWLREGWEGAAVGPARGPRRPGPCHSRAGRAQPTPHRRLTVQALPAAGRKRRVRGGGSFHRPTQPSPPQPKDPGGNPSGSRLIKASFGPPSCPQRLSPPPPTPLFPFHFNRSRRVPLWHR